jgi:Alw26I/Eco31I/Esp3I family type II restriction endonuclease
MTREKREWHPDFIKYMKFIVGHSNYKGIPRVYKDDGSIRWVVTGKSSIGRERYEWWKRKAKELGIPIEGKWISKAAKMNHPTKEKICQTCGLGLSIAYLYPTKNLIKKLNKIPGFEDEFDYYDFRTVKEIIHEIIITLKEEGFYKLSRIFSVPDRIGKTESEYWDYIYKNYVMKEIRLLSPGAMSNAPDRLDGFHTYNICCRAVQDTGRHQENLSRYIEDRRAYEHWSDGDWKTASWLMRKGYGECGICGNIGELTADHIGPLSLGFAHLPRFQPLCRSCNSAKNNRMFLHDLESLIGLEQQGETIISWHSKYIWDNLKYKVRSERDAKRLSKFMRTAHHYFLESFYIISSAGYKDFLLQYLNPQFAYYEQIEFENLNNSTYEYTSIRKVKGTKKQYQNNAARYIRIAFESLEEYHEKKNRKIMLQLINHYPIVQAILKELKGDPNYNPNLRLLMEKAFEATDKKTREETLKNALAEFERNPYINNKIDGLIKESLGIISDMLIPMW